MSSSVNMLRYLNSSCNVVASAVLTQLLFCRSGTASFRARFDMACGTPEGVLNAGSKRSAKSTAFSRYRGSSPER